MIESASHSPTVFQRIPQNGKSNSSHTFGLSYRSLTFQGDVEDGRKRRDEGDGGRMRGKEEGGKIRRENDSTSQKFSADLRGKFPSFRRNFTTEGVANPQRVATSLRGRPSVASIRQQPAKDFNLKMQEALWPHIESFNVFTDFYLSEIVKSLPLVYVDTHYEAEKHELNPFYRGEGGESVVDSKERFDEYLKLGVADITIGYPIRSDAEDATDNRMFPRYCRDAHISYSAPLWVKFTKESSKGEPCIVSKTMLVGRMPIMVKSNRCHLEGLLPSEITRAGEDLDELGGYFIINGIEKVIRFVIQQRANYPIAIKNPRFKTRDVFGTEHAILMRCQRYDGTSTTNILFNSRDNRPVFRVLINRRECFCPFWLLFRCLVGGLPTKQLKERFLEGSLDDSSECIFFHNLLEDLQAAESLYADSDIFENRYMRHFGKVFWNSVSAVLRPGSRYEDAASYVIKEYILVHIEAYADKFECLLMMYRKLQQLVKNEIQVEGIDSPAYHEVILPGQLVSSVLKDAIYSVLMKMRLHYLNDIRSLKASEQDAFSMIQGDRFFDVVTERYASDIGLKINYFFSTGNLRTYNLDLQQLSGWTMVADRLNLHRFMSHFRAVHRGQFFSQMKTTTVRKLLGEAWGFICPVHTPDGGSCGLLLHLAQDAVPVTAPPRRSTLNNIKLYMESRGCVVDLDGKTGLPPNRRLSNSFPFSVDGIPICYLRREEFQYWISEFRKLKHFSREGFKPHMELIGFDKDSGQFEGIFLSTFPGRLIRPVIHIMSNSIEWIGPIMQPWSSIACTKEEIVESLSLTKEQKKIIEEITHLQANSSSSSSYIPSFLEISSRRMSKLSGKKEEFSVKKRKKSISGGLEEEDFTPFGLDLKVDSEEEEEEEGKEEEEEEEEKEEEAIKSKAKQAISEYEEALLVKKKIFQQAPLSFEYLEIHPTTILSITASCTPFSNHNQSPRNMYQCQMLKQTMGTPFHCIPYRNDNKAYRLYTPQRPLVRTRDYRRYDFDDYPSGMNAVVAVISYTGFDMEDAMIINKAAVERGAFHGCVYKTKVIDAAPSSVRNPDSAKDYIFCNKDASGNRIIQGLETDGLPAVGEKLRNGSIIARVEDARQSTHTHTGSSGAEVRQEKYKEDEEATVEKVTLVATPPDSKTERIFKTGITSQRASIMLSCLRKPLIGDKFASRHGQKGILSMHWPHEDMPFTESGIVPDIIFNPHGFPSRMTIGMLIESMAGKSAALHGSFQDATPFRKLPRQEEFGVKWIDQCGYQGWVRRGGRYMSSREEAAYENDDPADYFGKALLSAGYQYYGKESMYSGVFGCELEANIFIGCIYYQRLRHMVSDKAQVRSTGPIDALTHQPVKGRKHHGGIRFGEMERDSLLSHGTAALLQDRLMHCSDEHKSFVCPSCGSILSPCLDHMRGRCVGGTKPVPLCRLCGVTCRLVALPFVFRYITNELAAMNITIRLHLHQNEKPLIVPVDESRGTDPLQVLQALQPTLDFSHEDEGGKVEVGGEPWQKEDVAFTAKGGGVRGVASTRGSGSNSRGRRRGKK